MYPPDLYEGRSGPCLVSAEALPDGGPYPTSAEFFQAVEQAIEMAARSDDLPIAYVARSIPVYPQQRPTAQQIQAAGCTYCTYLGLWADKWPGFPVAEHGSIWLYEEGIRKQATNRGVELVEQTYRVLMHEYDHALQRDHVLEKLGLPNLARHQ